MKVKKKLRKILNSNYGILSNTARSLKIGSRVRLTIELPLLAIS